MRMRTLAPIVALFLALAAGSAAASTPVLGQVVLYRYDSTHTYVAIVAGVWGPGEADLVIFNDYQTGYSFNFGLNSRYDWPSTYMADISEGVTDNRWRIDPDVGDRVTGETTPTLTLGGAAVQFNAERDVEYSVVVKIAVAITLTTGAAGHVDLVCDSNASPTTIRDTASTELTGTLVVGANLVHSSTFSLHRRVQAGDYCKLTTTNDTGTPTYTLVRQMLQTLG